jgi:hypothetical protein
MRRPAAASSGVNDDFEPEENAPMLPANHYLIRTATPQDEPMLRRLAYLDSQAPLAGRILVGELAGVALAAISVDERRLVADPFAELGRLRIHMRMQAAAVEAYERTPSLPERMLAALRGRRASVLR